jgi:predicted phage baseplate assembly protein
LTRWDFDPLEEGTGEYPPLVEDRELASRIVTWIRITAAPEVDPAEQRPARLSWIGVNVARVIQALEVPQERLGIGSGTPNQSFKVANTPVILERPATMGSPAPPPTFHLDLIDPQGRVSTWSRIDDLNAAQASDEVFTLDPEAGFVQCGDGLRGKRFPFGSVLRARYEYGGGAQGELTIGALNKAPALPGGIKVLNPVPTWGASDGETVVDAQRKISHFLRHRDRLVTAEDFKDIALQTPGVTIGRVEVVPLYDPDVHEALLALNFDAEPPLDPGIVTVMAVQDHPVEQTVVPESNHLFRSAIRAWLEPRRLITTEVYVREPFWVDIVVSVGIRLRAGQISAIVKRDVALALRTFLSPLVGGIPLENSRQGEGFPLATELRREDLIAVVSRTPGVRYVEELKLAVVRNGVASDSLSLTFRGIQLPWLVNLSVEEGTTAAGIQSLVNAAIPSDGVTVPVTPRECD